jgi:hypothetical protein
MEPKHRDGGVALHPFSERGRKEPDVKKVPTGLDILR